MELRIPKLREGSYFPSLLELCRRIREVSDIPIIILSAKGQEMDKVQGLREGADDYIVKPMGRKELIARVETALRRASTPASSESQPVYGDGEVLVDYPGHEVYVRGEKVDLTNLEYRLLIFLIRHGGQVLTHAQLADRMWGVDYDSYNNVKWHIGRLRRKIERTPANPQLITTVRGVGYRYERRTTKPSPNDVAIA